jgi:dTDP-4-amino-4,6-dideoxygalactose transaminase
MIWRCDLVPQYEKYQEEIDDAIHRVLLSGRYILSSETGAFEEEFAAYNDVKYAIGVANGTDAIILSLKALGIGGGDEVITSPFTAFATVSAIIATGATPVFVDICRESFLMDLSKVGSLITSKTKAIIPVHIFGNVVNIPKLREIVGDNIPIIEDACQAHGSSLNGIKAGAMGNVGAFSFYPTKNLGGYGDGGTIITNNKELADKIKLMRMYGMKDKDHTVISGINSRLDEIQAAVLRVKLKYLDTMNKQRNKIAQRYIKELNSSSFIHQHIEENVFSNYHIFETRFKGKRDKLIKYLDSGGIQANIYYLLPHHLQESIKYLGYKEGHLPIIENLCKEVIALPMYPELSHQVIEKIIVSVNGLIKNRGFN